MSGERLVRRLISCSVLGLGFLAMFAGLPLWLALAAIVDLAWRPGGLRWSVCRCVLFFALYLACEVAGVLWAAGLWAVGWLPGVRARWTALHYRLQRRWGAALVAGCFWLYDMRLEVEGGEALDGRPVLFLMRHASLADGVLTLRLVCADHGYTLRYALKRELLWDPCLDIVGHRLPNVFLRRDARDSAAEIAAVGDLARGLGRGEGVMIFPEGTRFSPRRKAAALERLAGQPVRRARAEALQHLLPPRPGGVLGLLDANPEVDVVFCALVGLEGALHWWDWVAGRLVGTRLRARMWRVPAAEIPRTPEARVDWLDARWADIDAWVGARLAEGRRPAG